jgi:hypothetical protein
MDRTDLPHPENVLPGVSLNGGEAGRVEIMGSGLGCLKEVHAPEKLWFGCLILGG